MQDYQSLQIKRLTRENKTLRDSLVIIERMLNRLDELTENFNILVTDYLVSQNTCTVIPQLLNKA